MVMRCNKHSEIVAMPAAYRACPEHYAELVNAYPDVTWEPLIGSWRKDGTNPCDYVIAR